MTNDEANNCYYFAVKNLSELNSLRWLRGKIEAITNNDNSLKNALDDAWNYQTIKTYPERISKLKPYINKYNWEGIELPAEPTDYKKFERNDKTIVLNILFIPHNTKTMIADGKKWYYLVVTNLSALFEGKSSNHHGHGNFYCLNCFNS